MANTSFGSGFKTGFGSAFLQFALERFASFSSLAWREISLILGVEDELRKLQRTFSKIQDLVNFVEGSPFQFSGAWQMWFEDIRKLAYDADALLDHVSLHLSSFCAENSGNNNKVSMVMSSLTNVQIPRMIADMQKKLDELAKEMESLVAIEKAKFDANTTLAARSSQFSDFHFEGSSFVGDTVMVGREWDRVQLVDFLRAENEKNFSVISIVGMGGIGKTALTQHVYNYEELEFDLKIWVSVSMYFDVVKITKSIIEHAIIGGCNISDLHALQLMLKDILGGKKFLLVLDDYWSENCDDWNTLSWPFRFGSRGSKVIVTTRSRKASVIVRSDKAHKLDILQDGDCWELIRRSASEAPQSLVPISGEIAGKCKGLPLAATILGSMLHATKSLYSSSDEEEWQQHVEEWQHYVLENELADMPLAKKIFLNLMRSYQSLPAHLRKCFAYCAIFPHKYEFEMEELVHLWMAEGFIQLVEGRRLEDLGRDYVNDLCSRSLFEQCMTLSGQKRYKMHDLIHDMARLVSKGICFHGKKDSESSFPLFGNTCHLCLFHDNTEPLELKASLENERLRTFLVISDAITSTINPQLFSHLKFLRVLGLSGCGLTELTSNVDQLIYLRYLNLSENLILRLPESICKLVALQILKLRNCIKLCELPKDIKNLFNLRHLDMDIERQLKVMPKQFGKLSNLQSLSAYIVGIEKGNGIEELKNMKWLRGSLRITRIDVIPEEDDAKEAQLDQKTCLDKLELEWKELQFGLDPQLLNRRKKEQAKVLERLCPHENLKELLIQNYCGIDCPTWLSQSSRNFTSIKLEGLKYCVNLPSLGELPLLKSFAISDMPLLQYVDNCLRGSGTGAMFPSLESFEIRGMSGLEDWTIAIRDEDMPCIDTFMIRDCPNLKSLPQKLRDLPKKDISGCKAGIEGRSRSIIV